jgi:hypothetical protein
MYDCRLLDSSCTDIGRKRIFVSKLMFLLSGSSNLLFSHFCETKVCLESESFKFIQTELSSDFMSKRVPAGSSFVFRSKNVLSYKLYLYKRP